MILDLSMLLFTLPISFGIVMFHQGQEVQELFILNIAVHFNNHLLCNGIHAVPFLKSYSAQAAQSCGRDLDEFDKNASLCPLK